VTMHLSIACVKGRLFDDPNLLPWSVGDYAPLYSMCQVKGRLFDDPNLLPLSVGGYAPLYSMCQVI